MAPSRSGTAAAASRAPRGRRARSVGASARPCAEAAPGRSPATPSVPPPPATPPPQRSSSCAPPAPPSPDSPPPPPPPAAATRCSSSAAAAAPRRRLRRRAAKRRGGEAAARRWRRRRRFCGVEASLQYQALGIGGEEQRQIDGNRLRRRREVLRHRRRHQELVKLDGPGLVGIHLLKDPPELLASRPFDRLEGRVELVQLDGPRTVVVDDVEGLAQLRYRHLRQLRRHHGRSDVRPLLLKPAHHRRVV